MAQSKSFFGLRRGSTKTLTFSIYNGKQVTKDRVADVKNPRSSAQMKQRAVMATALRGYSALKEICDHSFEGLTYGQPSMNYFISQNARMIRATAPNVNLSLAKGNSVSNAYIISKGSLTGPRLVAHNNGEEHVFMIEIAFSESYTFGSVMNQLGATSIGDMITFVHLVNNEGSNASVYWMRLKLTEENASKSITLNTGTADIIASLVEGVDFETNIDNFTTGDFPISIEVQGSNAGLFIASAQKKSAPTSESMGVIISRKSDAGWLRSSNTMVNLFDTFNYAEALASYPESGEKILNGGNV